MLYEINFKKLNKDEQLDAIRILDQINKQRITGIHFDSLDKESKKYFIAVCDDFGNKIDKVIE